MPSSSHSKLSRRYFDRFIAFARSLVCSFTCVGDNLVSGSNSIAPAELSSLVVVVIPTINDQRSTDDSDNTEIRQLTEISQWLNLSDFSSK